MIKIITVGKIKSFLKQTELEYFERIKMYNKIEIIEIDDYKDNNPNIIIRKEEEKILQKLKDEFVIVLDANGAALSTREFSNIVKNNANITFIIGGAYGIGENVKKRANKMLSLSKLTFTYGLSLVILLEQIYRSYTIIKGLPYNK